VSVSRGTAVDDFVATLIDMYNERGAEDSAVRVCVALVFKECMVQAGDVMRDYSSTVSKTQIFCVYYPVRHTHTHCYTKNASAGRGCHVRL
jgi:hypothetical protein